MSWNGPLLSEAMCDARLVAQARSVLAQGGRLHLPGFLDEMAAKTLFEACRGADWKVVFAAGQGSVDLAAADAAALDPAKKVELVKAIHGEAATGFQFMFDSYRISAEAEKGVITSGVFASFFDALNSEPTLQQLRALTGDERIAYVDAQATRYRAGHFLTNHDDSDKQQDRLFAYVINLTPAWSVDWGGLLMFLAEDGHVAEAFTPKWNAVNILKVPQPHAVSMVAPFARGARYSITGWMRSRRP